VVITPVPISPRLGRYQHRAESVLCGAANEAISAVRLYRT